MIGLLLDWLLAGVDADVAAATRDWTRALTGE